jgi:hypothetical protein
MITPIACRSSTTGDEGVKSGLAEARPGVP